MCFHVTVTDIDCDQIYLGTAWIFGEPFVPAVFRFNKVILISSYSCPLIISYDYVLQFVKFVSNNCQNFRTHRFRLIIP